MRYYDTRSIFSNVTVTASARLAAIGFGLGGIWHAVNAVLVWRGVELYGPDYPGGRHVLMALVDASIAFVAMRHARWLVWVLLSFAVEQFIVNGIEWTPIAVLIAAVFVGYQQRHDARL